MRPRGEDELRRWLAAERTDDEAGAEAALAALFATLPAPAPPLGFAARTVALARADAAAAVRAGAVAAARGRGLLATLWGRLLLGLALVTAGLAAPFAPAVLRWLAGGFDAEALVAAVPRLLAAASARLVTGIEALMRLFDFAGSLAVPFESPAVAAGLLGLMLVGAAAFRFLVQLIAVDRSWSHVDVHG